LFVIEGGYAEELWFTAGCTSVGWSDIFGSFVRGCSSRGTQGLDKFFIFIQVKLAIVQATLETCQERMIYDLRIKHKNTFQPQIMIICGFIGSTSK
jgi:hypothetical protein